jgi:hypothetical protein
MLTLLKLIAGTAIGVIVICMVLFDLAKPGPAYDFRYVLAMLVGAPVATILICLLAPASFFTRKIF